MSTLHIAWVKLSGMNAGGEPGAVIKDLISAEALSTSGTSAQSASAPAGATHAQLVAVDANHYVSKGAAAAATNSICLLAGGFDVLPVKAGEKIAAKTF